MSIFESIRLAFVALAANKLRSFLTMLGVIIGVGSVIIMISIVQGARKAAVDSFQQNGSNIVFAFYSPQSGKRRGGSFEGLTLNDVKVLQERVTTIGPISPSLTSSMNALYKGKQRGATIEGVLANYTDVNKVEMSSGRFVNEEDVNEVAKTCVIGDTVRKDLFGKEEAVGKTISLEGNGLRIPMTVVGVLKHKGRGFGSSADEQIFTGLPTLQKRLTGTTTVGSLSVRALGADGDTVADQIFAVLKEQHPANAKDFIVDTQSSIIKQLDTFLALFQIILGGVGGLSLLVGGIGIMNIMLVSVTERTREIGIRKAIGAKRSDILTQFVTESMTVSGVGGLIGVGFGMGVSQLIGILAADKLKTFVPGWAILLGFGFAVGVGMFFGIYPAVRASRLDPIQALRYE